MPLLRKQIKRHSPFHNRQVQSYHQQQQYQSGSGIESDIDKIQTDIANQHIFDILTLEDDETVVRLVEQTEVPPEPEQIIPSQPSDIIGSGNIKRGSGKNPAQDLIRKLQRNYGL